MRSSLLKLMITCCVFSTIFIAGCDSTKTNTQSTVLNPTSISQPEITKPTPAKVEYITPKKAPKPLFQLDATKPKCDFGEVMPKQKCKGKVILTNKGKATIKLKKTSTSCSCVAYPKIKKTTLAPEESTTLTFTYIAKTAPGKHSQYLKVPYSPIIDGKISTKAKSLTIELKTR